jgi:hypothetical protein
MPQFDTISRTESRVSTVSRNRSLMYVAISLRPGHGLVLTIQPKEHLQP